LDETLDNINLDDILQEELSELDNID